jgi:hypothetical protein
MKGDADRPLYRLVAVFFLNPTLREVAASLRDLTGSA